MNSNLHHHEQNHQTGFSLIELMVTLGVIAIAAAVASPAIMTMVPAMQLRSATRDLYSNLQQARLQAVKENRTISVRFNTASCTDASTANDRDCGYYIDANNDGAFTAGEKQVIFEDYDDDADTVLNADKGVEFFNPPEANKDWNNVNTAQVAAITFNSRGTVVAPTGSVFLVNTSVNGDYAALKAANETVTGYGVDIRTSGSVKTFKYSGTLPMAQAKWSR